MATPDSINLSSVPMPKLIESNKYKVRRDVLDTSQDVIPTSSVLPSFQDRVIHFKVTIYSCNVALQNLFSDRTSIKQVHKS